MIPEKRLPALGADHALMTSLEAADSHVTPMSQKNRPLARPAIHIETRGNAGQHCASVENYRAAVDGKPGGHVKFFL
jgi:hypothetical protein